jgi:hypothetical protein
MNEGTKSPRVYTRAEAINIAIALAALSTGTESLSSLLRFLHDDRGCEPESRTGRVANHLGQLETVLKCLRDANSRFQFLGKEIILSLSPNVWNEPFSIYLPPPSAK